VASELSVFTALLLFVGCVAEGIISECRQFSVGLVYVFPELVGLSVIAVCVYRIARRGFFGDARCRMLAYVHTKLKEVAKSFVEY
jgi:hypothetical protein